MIPYSKIFENSGTRNVKNNSLYRCKTMCQLAAVYANYDIKRFEGCYEKCRHKHEVNAKLMQH